MHTIYMAHLAFIMHTQLFCILPLNSLCIGTIVLTIVRIQMYYRLNPGEMMTLDNRRVMHGRTGLKDNGGTRRMEV